VIAQTACVGVPARPPVPRLDQVTVHPTQEAVIVGYKPGEGQRAGTIASLVLAVPDTTGALRYAGRGTGFTTHARRRGVTVINRWAYLLGFVAVLRHVPRHPPPPWVGRMGGLAP
jgi:hypothetical protein